MRTAERIQLVFITGTLPDDYVLCRAQQNKRGWTSDSVKKKKDFTLTFYYLQLLRGSMQRTPSVSDSEKARFLQHIIFFLKAVLCYSRLEQQEHTNRGSGTFNTYTHSRCPPPPTPRWRFGWIDARLLHRTINTQIILETLHLTSSSAFHKSHYCHLQDPFNCLLL